MTAPAWATRYPVLLAALGRKVIPSDADCGPSGWKSVGSTRLRWLPLEIGRILLRSRGTLSSADPAATFVSAPVPAHRPLPSRTHFEPDKTRTCPVASGTDFRHAETRFQRSGIVYTQIETQSPWTPGFTGHLRLSDSRTRAQVRSVAPRLQVEA